MILYSAQYLNDNRYLVQAHTNLDITKAKLHLGYYFIDNIAYRTLSRVSEWLYFKEYFWSRFIIPFL